MFVVFVSLSPFAGQGRADPHGHHRQGGCEDRPGRGRRALRQGRRGDGHRRRNEHNQDAEEGRLRRELL